MVERINEIMLSNETSRKRSFCNSIIPINEGCRPQLRPLQLIVASLIRKKNDITLIEQRQSDEYLFKIGYYF